ncbi:MAG: hypothetical protein JWR54_2511 [Mucilaginibacter sp.]|nr:hypothetical protein [Mucilaginibacter sp.]
MEVPDESTRGNALENLFHFNIQKNLLFTI